MTVKEVRRVIPGYVVIHFFENGIQQFSCYPPEKELFPYNDREVTYIRPAEYDEIVIGVE